MWKEYLALPDDKIKSTFNSPSSTHNEIFKSGSQFLCHPCPASKYVTTQGINFLCYSMFNQSCSRRRSSKIALHLESLPPTADATRQHIYGVYLKIQSRRGNDLHPLKWGWKMKDSTFIPIKMTRPVSSCIIYFVVAKVAVRNCEVVIH